MKLREIDVLIEKHIFNGYNLRKVTPEECTEIAGDNVSDELAFDDDGNWVALLPKYSENIYFAWGIVRKLNFARLVKTNDKRFYAEFVATLKTDGLDRIDLVGAFAETEPIAICKAALKTKGIEI